MRVAGLRLWLLLTTVAVCGCARAPDTPYVPIVPSGVRCAVPLRWTGEDATARVRIAGEDAGEVRLRGGGVTHVRSGPFAAGRVRVELVVGDRTERHDVFALERGKPAIVCDVDHTIDAAGSMRALVGSDAGRPVAGSVEALHALAKDHAIVYLTARAEPLWERTEAFLVREGFPAGPILGWRMAEDPVSRIALKRRRLRELEDVWPAARWGIGDKASDEAAYRAAGLGSILLDPEADDAVVTTGKHRWRARSWPDIVSLIREQNAKVK